MKKWKDVSEKDKQSYRMGHYYYTHNKNLEQCHNEWMKRGWMAAQKAYTETILKEATGAQ